MIRAIYTTLSLGWLIRAMVIGPFAVLRFLARALLIREVMRWTR